MPRIRLGVALLLPSPVADQVDGLRRAIGDRSLGRAPVHVTLVPPVNVKQVDLGRALAILRAAAGATPRVLTIGLGAPTSFLPANPVLYLPVEGDLGPLAALRDRVLTPPLARPLAWPFVPHVTLANLSPGPPGPERPPPGPGYDHPTGTEVAPRTAALIAHAVEALAGYRAVVHIERVHLLTETRNLDTPGRAGPRWRPLADASFGSPAVVARGGPLAVEMVRSQLLCPEGAALLRAEGLDPDRLGPSQADGGADRGRGGRAGGDRGGADGRPTMVVTARREARVVGVAGAWLGADGGRSAVLVATEHRGQGIGRHLGAALQAAVADAAWGCSELRPIPDPRPSLGQD